MFRRGFIPPERKFTVPTDHKYVLNVETFFNSMVQSILKYMNFNPFKYT